MKTNTITHTQSELISLKATAHRLNLSLRGVYRLIASGALPRPVKVGGSSKLFERDIQRYLATLEAQRENPYGLPARLQR
jgi:predicted DNA-binding transcriptional regulator AlpA